MSTFSITFFSIIAIIVILVITCLFLNMRAKKKFREEYNEIDRGIRVIPYHYSKPQIIFDLVFMNAEGKRVYKHNTFDYDRFDLINEWLQKVGAEELLFEDYSELIDEIKKLL